MLENKEDKVKCLLVEVHANLIVTSCIEDNVNMVTTSKGVSGFLAITLLPLAMPRLLLHILDVDDKSFHMVYSLYRILTARILNIRPKLNPEKINLWIFLK